MRVHVRHRLAGVGPRVKDNPVATAGDSLRLGDLPHLGQHLGQQRRIGGRQSGQVRIVISGDHQDVRRSLRADVTKRKRPR